MSLLREATSWHAGEALQRVKVSPSLTAKNKLNKKKANFPNDKQTSALLQKPYWCKILNNSEFWFIIAALYHSHLQPPPFCLIWPPLLACHITMATGTQERDTEEERERERKREKERVTHFFCLVLEIIWKRPAYHFFGRVTFCMTTCKLIIDATDLRDCIVNSFLCRWIIWHAICQR